VTSQSLAKGANVDSLCVGSASSRSLIPATIRDKWPPILGRIRSHQPKSVRSQHIRLRHQCMQHYQFFLASPAPIERFSAKFFAGSGRLSRAAKQQVLQFGRSMDPGMSIRQRSDFNFGPC